MVQVLIGTSGWNYKEWRADFYPPEVKREDELTYMAHHFKSVENNSSFYHMPAAQTLAKWHDLTPDEFKFSIKLTRLFTHDYRLRVTYDLRQELRSYLEAIQAFREKLGAVLIQTPPDLACEPAMLKDFLEILKFELQPFTYKPQLAIEFRNEEWFTDKTYDLLRRQNIALVMAQSSKYPLEKVLTADFAYFRFHGPKEWTASHYTDDQLQRIARYVAALPVDTAYVYFNNTRGGYAANNALTFQEKVVGLIQAGV